MSPDAIADHALLTVSRWQRGARTVTVRLCHLDGRPWASAGFLPPYQPGAKWDWIRETVAHECECDPDQVGCIESDEGDLITVDGMPCYRVDNLLQRSKDDSNATCNRTRIPGRRDRCDGFDCAT